MAGATDLMKVGASNAVKPTSSTASATVTPDNTINDACGSSYVEWLSKTEFKTGYTINTSAGPPALKQTWNVAVYSPIDFLSYNLDGLPRTPVSWWATRTTDIQADKGMTVEALAGGTVTTFLGGCYSDGPIATYVK